MIGCAVIRPVVLRPAPGAETVSLPGGGRAATAAVSGVRVTVNSQTWPGDAPISQAVTPLRVRIENNSNKPIAVRYHDIALVSPSGQAFAALPPYRIDATVQQPRLVPGFPVLNQPGFVAKGFAVSPLFAPAYPGLPVATHSAFYNPRYFGYYGSHWRYVALPTLDMLQHALPEGTVAAGGDAEGFLYFQPVDADVGSVRFRMEIANAENEQLMGTVGIPLLVSQNRSTAE